jgi:Lhr-like helicase
MNKFIINQNRNLYPQNDNTQDDISDIYDMDQTVEPENPEEGFDNYEDEINMEDYQENFNDDNPDFINFKQNVKDWLSLDDDIRTLQDALKERKKKKSSLTPKISQYMSSFKINDLNTPDGKLKFAKATSITAASKKYIEQRIIEYFKDENKSLKILDYIYNHREKKERVYLRRFIPKKDKK